MTNRPCPACGHWYATPVTHVDLVTIDDHPLQGGFTVVSCDRCGTGFTNVSSPIEFYNRFYEVGAKYATEEPDQWTVRRAVETTDRIINRLNLAGSERILDIGSGNGLVVDCLHDHGFDNVAGLDPSGANGAVVGSLYGLPNDIGKFDVVLLTGVLEHLWDVDDAVGAVASLLNPSGTVYVEVPDATAYAADYLGPFEDFNTEHVNHFSSDSLRILGKRFGFDSETKTELIPFAPGINARYLTHIWHSVVRLNTELRRSLMTYAERSNTDVNVINAHLERGLGDSRSFNLWGAGECAYRFLALLALKRRYCALVVDSDQRRRSLTVGGSRVVAPAALLNNRYPIIIASTVRRDGILEAAERLGVGHRIVGTV